MFSIFASLLETPRSGTSLIGSLLDAHPNMVVSHELDILKHVKHRKPFNRIAALIVANSARQAKKGRKGSGYDFDLTSSWQGRFDRLKVVGDKKAVMTTFRFSENPELLEELTTKTDFQLKLVYVVRNPFDVVATMFKKNPAYKHLDDVIDYYLNITSCTSTIVTSLPRDSVHVCSLEEFINEPEAQIAGLCAFFGEKAEPEFMKNCTNLLFDSPKESANDIDWPPEQSARLTSEIEKDPILSSYGYAKAHPRYC